MDSSWPFQDIVDRIIADLVSRDYAELERRCHGVHLSAAEMAATVAAYGRRITMPPTGANSICDVVRISSSDVPAWSVYVSLWTLEEGLSDLTLELTVYESPAGYRVEVDNLHVL